MSNSKFSQFVAQGTTAERTAHVPDPPTPPAGVVPDFGYFWWDRDTQTAWAWDNDAADWVEISGGGGGGGTHTLLASATHTDTLTGTVVRGDLIVGNSTPKWARLAVGTANQVLGTDGTDVAWVTSTGTGNNVRATSPTLTTPNIGTPSAGTLTNCTGLPIATGVSGLAAGIATFLATPSSANLLAAVTDETGTGALVFGTSPTFTTQITVTGSVLAVPGGLGRGILNTAYGTARAFEAVYDAGTDWGILQMSAGNNAFGVYNEFVKTRSTDGTTLAAVSTNDTVMVLNSYADSGSAIPFVARLYTSVTGAVGGTNWPGMFGVRLGTGSGTVDHTFTPTIFTSPGSVVATTTMTTGAASGTTGAVLFKGTTSGTVTLSVADAAGTYTLKLPTADGTSGQAITTNGSGQLSFSTVGGGGLTVGTTTITSGTSGRILYDNAGVLGEVPVTGTPGSVVLSDTPTIVTPAITTSATVTRTSVGTTSADGLVLTNTTAAAAGAQQYSPRLRRSGFGWKTNATAASQQVEFWDEAQPVQGAANPIANLVFSSAIASGAAVSPFYIQWDGTSTPSVCGVWASNTGSRGLWAQSGILAGVSQVGRTTFSTDGGSYLNASGLFLRGDAGVLQWATGTDPSGAAGVVLRKDADNVLAQRNSTNAQTFRVYSTYTNSTNGAWAEVDTTTANTLKFGSNGNGTGASTMSKLQFNVLATNKLDYGVTSASTWTFADSVTLADAKDFAFGTTTGTRHGTATSQKQSFWNATPIVQPTTAVAGATFTANSGTAVNDASTFDGYTVGQVVKALRNVGLLA